MFNFQSSARSLAPQSIFSIRLTAFIAALAFFICLSAAQSTSAVTFIVNSTTDANDINTADTVCEATAGVGDCTLRAAISQANALAGADIITLPAGTYTTTLATTNEDANANGDFDILQDLTITGADAATTIVQANTLANTATDRVFHNVTAGVNVTLSGMTVQNGRLTSTTSPAGRGGGIQNAGNMTLTNVIVTGNQTVTRAGGIHSFGVGNQITLNTTTVTGNTVNSAANSTFAAGMFVDTGTTNINNSSISNNTATSTFLNGSGISAGFYALNGSVTITGSTFNGNTGNGNGTGGSFATGMRFTNIATAPMIVNISNTTVNNNVGNTANGSNHAAVGIAIQPAAANPITATLTNVTSNGNTGSNSGAGFYVSGAGGTVNVNGSNITNNTLNSAALNNFGAGVAIFGTGASIVTFNNTNITGNSSTATGTFFGLAGGIYNQGSTVVLNNCTVATNNANLHGGIRTLASVTNATTTLNSSTVNGNTAGEGGGIVNIISATTTLTTTTNINNSTISGNSVSGFGGGIEQFGTGGVGVTSLSNSTVAFNTANNDNTGAETGGGIDVTTGTLNTRSTIIGRNSVGTGGTSPDISGTIVSGDYNLIQDTSGTIIAFAQNFAPNDITGVDPLLLPLANNGGTTLTHALSMNSPAIDKGNSFGTTTDQRGQLRPVDMPGIPNAADGSDIGAFELSPTAASATVSGRVVLPFDIGLTGARVTLTDSRGNSRTVLSGKAGYFRFADVATGETYVVTVSARRYTFAPQVVNVTQDITELVFSPQ